jgi:acyl carrier protein phosphodiesterase
MNWLAHAYLSKRNIEFRVGNILPDLVSITELNTFPAAYQEGIRCHRAIDRFTDVHPIVKSGISRMPAEYRRYGGIVTDVFYDHFLAKHWACFSPVSLHEFAQGFYRDLALISDELPPDIFYRFQRILEHRVFESYQQVAGIELALQRIDGRLKRPVNLGAAVAVLNEHYELFENEFMRFFTELQQHIKPYIADA